MVTSLLDSISEISENGHFTIEATHIEDDLFLQFDAGSFGFSQNIPLKDAELVAIQMGAECLEPMEVASALFVGVAVILSEDGSEWDATLTQPYEDGDDSIKVTFSMKKH